MKRLFLNIFLIGLSSVSSGCASLNSKFDCPMEPGVMCKSLDEVNMMVDQGKLGGKSFHSEPFLESTTPSFDSALTTSSHPRHSGETITRIWIASYEDSDGDYYAPSLLYRVVKPNHWTDHPSNNDE